MNPMLHSSNPWVDLAILALSVYWLILVGRMLLDLVPGARLNLTEAYRWIHRFTEPLLAPLRRLLPPVEGVDVSPIGALLVIMLIKELVILLEFRL